MDTYYQAKFWKCALQVNPSGYIAYRGDDHGLSPSEYNRRLLEVALENDIKVIGLADHGNVDAVDEIREIMRGHGIIVFPGFEIATTEKAHFVCLFPEDTTKVQLNRYLGALGLTDPADGVWPSDHGGNQLLQKVEDLGGIAYAAHCTDESGVLQRKLVHIWQNPQLRAAQIPGTLDDLRNEAGYGYRQVLLNKDSSYKRELPVGTINAKDVARPEDLANPRASCRIKMTNPSFSSFKLAFQDPESRVRLNSDVSEKFYSRIEKLTITGGYLDGVAIRFSEHLNGVIGGRGTGKSTLLESIRFALDFPPIGKSARKQHDEIIKENLGKSAARVELVIRSSKMNGKRFTVGRRYGESPSVKDENGTPSSFLPTDLLPEVEIYGQNEIYEIAQDTTSQCELLERFLEGGHQESETQIGEAIGKLVENRTKLIEAQEAVAVLEDEVGRLPKLEEELRQFESLGLNEKLKIVPLLESEKRLLKKAKEEDAPTLDEAFQAIREYLPDVTAFGEAAIGKLPHAESLRKIRSALEKLRNDGEALLANWLERYAEAVTLVTTAGEELDQEIQKEEAELERTFKDLPSSEGKTGRQIGIEYQRLITKIEEIRPKKTLIETREKVVEDLEQQRRTTLDDLSAARAARSAKFSRCLRKLNRQLAGKLRLTVEPESDRAPVIHFLLGCKLEGVGEARLACLRDAQAFTPVRLAELVREGAEALREAGWGITPTVAEALTKLTPKQIYELEELELPDLVKIELNTAHGDEENFRPLDKLSTGQQCTAILHLLLLQNLDPLIMDQPEDNLDNAFIADRIVTELRSEKISRQFIFATHNANIPVFGDAEWIGVFEVSDGQASMPLEAQGAIDVEQVRDAAAKILEGGKAAFNQRKAKYGY